MSSIRAKIEVFGEYLLRTRIVFESLASYAKDAKLRGFYPALIDRSVEIDP